MYPSRSRVGWGLRLLGKPFLYGHSVPSLFLALGVVLIDVIQDGPTPSAFWCMGEGKGRKRHLSFPFKGITQS
jgi:hypothetical protein